MNDETNLEVIASFPNAMAAVGLLGALEQAGIRAESVGEFTAGFVAEAPGEVQILVNAADAAKAQAIRDSFRDAGESVDWSQVDVGDESPVSKDESDEVA